tara:strand:+ start:132 stop:689 length:558 start_codon:yes stop_codon:yes gene_type:complete
MKNTYKNVLISGNIDIGKTSLVKKIYELLLENKCNKNIMGGFYTTEVLNKEGDRIGFDIINLNNIGKIKFARKNIKSTYMIDGYGLSMSPFNYMITTLNNNNKKIHIIDEIGQMQILSSKFKSYVLTKLNDPDIIVFGSIKLSEESSSDFVKEIHSRNDTLIINITEENRENTTSSILQKIMVLL